MNDFVRAWRKDSDGHFFVMEAGETKPYGINYEPFLSEITGDALSTSEWTIAAGLTKVNENISGDVAIVNLYAPTAGEYSCSHKMTSDQGVIEITNFRVIVT